MVQQAVEVEEEVSVDELIGEALPKSLILWNDDHHTFNFVIEALIEVCKHDLLQAEQCTLLVHYKGKAEVKAGPYERLKPMREALSDRGLNATIEG